MQNPLSIDLPQPLIDLLQEPVFENYTVASSDENIRPRLELLELGNLFPNGVRDSEMANCCVSGIWLLHNFLHPSHEISQGIHSREGSFWHAIMHRLEGDFWNSKYWYRKVGNHPTFDLIDANFEPELYVDQCESASQQDHNSEIQLIAVAEWKALFEYCFINAQNQ